MGIDVRIRLGGCDLRSRLLEKQEGGLEIEDAAAKEGEAVVEGAAGVVEGFVG